MNKEIALMMQGITKYFGSVAANKNVDLTVYKGEILAILGENGCGKTTLMNMIAGIYYPDEGKIFVDGEEANIRSPKDAFVYRIGMIHQHFKLVDVFSASENIVLGVDDGKKYSIKDVNNRVLEISERYGFHIDPKKKIHEMSVSEKQTVEIIKVLYRGADILILDEPTAVLTPQETARLFDILRRMRDDGKSILIITHKLHEVLSLSDRVAILRKGEHVATVNTAETNESELTEMMVGKKVQLNIQRSMPQNPRVRLSVSDMNAVNEEGVKVLDSISFDAYSGEILGIAGIAGSGQRELLEAIAGLQHLESGKILYQNPKNGEEVNLRDKTPLQIRDLGVRLSFVPEDRLGMGLVGNMNITDNMMLRSYRRGHSMFVDRARPKKLAEDIIHSLAVVTPGLNTPVRRLSGGNVQKVLVGREISTSPTVLMAAYPVRGLDINSSYTIYNLLNKQKENGTAVIFVGEDLDVLLELCDRIMVICAGKITGVVEGRRTTKEELGVLMTRANAAPYENRPAYPLTDDVPQCVESVAEPPVKDFPDAMNRVLMRIKKRGEPQ
ncbi:MAG: ABC transporter ATP-binding protein [Clostridia bacterium]|nr:ABC transporter ATP-binding protein [Clostridia bacterium]